MNIILKPLDKYANNKWQNLKNDFYIFVANIFKKKNHFYILLSLKQVFRLENIIKII